MQSKHFREIARIIVHQLGIVTDITVLSVVLYYQIAELRVKFCWTALCPLLVLLAMVVIYTLT